MGTKKIVQETRSQVVNLQTGEVVSDISTNVYRIPTEPPFVKMYLDDLCVIISVPDAHKTLLLSLLRRLDFEGYIILSPRARKDIAKSLNIADQTFRNRLNDLCKKDLLRRVSTNEYQVNPTYFAKGEWKSICAQRSAFQMRVTYNEKGRSIETVKLNKADAPQAELPFEDPAE